MGKMTAAGQPNNCLLIRGYNSYLSFSCYLFLSLVTAILPKNHGCEQFKRRPVAPSKEPEKDIILNQQANKALKFISFAIICELFERIAL